MRGFNKVIIMGNLVRDPEVRYTQKQTAVASFTVACNRAVKQTDGSYKDTADFVPVVAWGKTAEMMQKYFHKGSGIHVEGRIQTRSYEDKQGTKKYVTEVLADGVLFAGGDRQSASSQKPAYSAPSRDTAPVSSFPEDGYTPVEMGDAVDIPF